VLWFTCFHGSRSVGSVESRYVLSTDSGDARPFPERFQLPNIDDLISSVLGSESQSKSLEQYSAILKRHVPTWDGKLDAPDDFLRLLSEMDKTFNGNPPSIEAKNEIKDATAEIFSSNFGLMIMGVMSRSHGDLDLFSAIEKVWQTSEDSLNAKRKGGEGTKEWTAEAEAKAREIFAELKRARMKDTPAYQRTCQRLLDEHGFYFSASTIRRYLKNSNA
jgi:hypothetical protein